MPILCNEFWEILKNPLNGIFSSREVGEGGFLFFLSWYILIEFVFFHRKKNWNEGKKLKKEVFQFSDFVFCFLQIQKLKYETFFFFKFLNFEYVKIKIFRKFFFVFFFVIRNGHLKFSLFITLLFFRKLLIPCLIKTRWQKSFVYNFRIFNKYFSFLFTFKKKSFSFTARI